MNRYFLQKYLPYTILLLAIISINPYSKLRITVTTFWWLLEVLILLMFYCVLPYITQNKKKINKVTLLVNLYLIYNLVNIVRGLFVADIYWDYKALFNNGLALLLPIVSLVFVNVNSVGLVLKFYIKYTLPLILFFFIFISSGAVGFYLVPISFLALFLPIIKKEWKYIVIGLSFFVIFLDFGARSNVVKFIVPMLFSSLYIFRKWITKIIYQVLRNILFVLPFLLFFLAVFSDFNVFKIGEYADGSLKQQKTSSVSGEVIEEDLAADTRSIIYIEVLNTAEKYDTWMFGRSPAKGNETEAFSSLSDLTGKSERYGNEVAILNVFTWTGVVGVFLYFLVFYHASFLSINRSNNTYSKIIGLYLAFRWCYAWVEDINYFTLTTYTLWMIVGISLSPSFRKMNDKEVKLWINSIFYKKIELKYRMYKAFKRKSISIES